jgi:DNA-binding transcriptional LysR family regulator
MDLEMLRTFLAVVRLQGMRPAAEALHVTQPAVSARIRELERTLEVRLFERRGRKLLLTTAGQVLLEESRNLLAAADSIQKRLAPLRGQQRGTLRLATIDAVSIYLLPEVYLEYRRAHPEIELLVQVVDSRRVLGALVQGDVDLGFLALPEGDRVPREPQLEFLPFYEDVMVCVASPSHELVGRPRPTLAALASQPLVLYSRGSHTRTCLDREFRAHGLVPQVAMETESPEAMKRLAEVGLGLAILPLAQVRQELADGRLRRLEPRDARFSRTLATVTRRGRRLGPEATSFLEHLWRRWPRPPATRGRGRRKKNRDPSLDGSR